LHNHWTTLPDTAEVQLTAADVDDWEIQDIDAYIVGTHDADLVVWVSSPTSTAHNYDAIA